MAWQWIGRARDTVLGSLLVGSLGAATEAPLVDIALAPLPAVRAHLASGPWGRVFADSRLEPLRHALEDATVSENFSGPLLTSVLSEHGVAFRLSHVSCQDEVTTWQWAASGDFAEEAQGLFQAWSSALSLTIAASAVTATPAGAESVDSAANDGLRLERRGSHLLFSNPHASPAPWDAGTADDDLRFTIHGHELVQALASCLDQRGDVRRQLQHLCEQGIGDISGAARCDAQGISSHILAQWPHLGFHAIDRSVCDHLPPHCLQVYCLGWDGAAWWEAYRAAVLAVVPIPNADPQAVMTIAQREAALDAQLQESQLPRLQDWFAACSGTEVVAITAGPPYGGYSLQLLRTPALERLLSSLLRRWSLNLPGIASPLAVPIPGCSQTPILVLSADQVLITTDALVAAQWPGAHWLQGQGASLFAPCPPGCVAYAGGDAQRTVVSLLGLLNTNLAQLSLSVPIDQAAILCARRLATAVGTESLSVVPSERGYVIDSHGLALTGWALPVALLSSGVSSCLNNRVAPTSQGVVESLKAFAVAETQFQAGAYIDENNTGVGEFAFLSELATGIHDANDQPLGLVDASYASGPVNGYSYVLYLPDGPAVDLVDPGTKPRQGHPAAAALRRRCWVAYAYPVASSDPAAPTTAAGPAAASATAPATTPAGSGPASLPALGAPAPGDEPAAPVSSWMYAIDQGGAVYRQAFTGTPPAWNALYAGKPWLSAPAWPLFSSADAPAAASP